MRLNEDSKVWIYGYAANGRRVAGILARQGIKIRGYIDRSPEQYPQARKQDLILKPDEITPSPDDVVICAIGNVFHHKEIAERLAKRGFSYLIYKSFQDSPAGKQIDLLYDDLTSFFQDAAVKGRKIPLYADVVKSKPQEDRTINACDAVHANIPVELIFGPTISLVESAFLDKNENLIRTFSEKSLLYYILPQKMMQYFVGEVDETAWKRSRKLWFDNRNAFSFASSAHGSYSRENERRHLEDRYGIFLEMTKRIQENPEFFRENPIAVTWNKNGWFNVQDGGNRAAFLLAKELYSLPVTMKASDYEAWLHMDEEVKQVRRALESVDRSLRAPILHPDFLDIPCLLEFYAHKKVTALCDWLWTNQIDPAGLTVCEYYCANDLCGSHLARMGGRLSVIDTEEQLALHKALDQLYRLDKVSYGTPAYNEFQIVLSNWEDTLEIFAADQFSAQWYVLEYVDAQDAGIEALASRFSLGKPQYLLRQLVGDHIYKVVIIKGKKGEGQ